MKIGIPETGKWGASENYYNIFDSSMFKRIAVGRNPHSAYVMKPGKYDIYRQAKILETHIILSEKGINCSTILPLWVEDSVDAAMIILLFPNATQLFKKYKNHVGLIWKN
jgi:hypothetical protein